MKSRKKSKTAVKKPAAKITRTRLGCVEAFKQLIDAIAVLQRDVNSIKATLLSHSPQHTYNRMMSVRVPQADHRILARQMFDDLRTEDLPPTTRNFIDSLEQGFQEYGSLTKRQYECLEQNWNSFINGIPF